MVLSSPSKSARLTLFQGISRLRACRWVLFKPASSSSEVEGSCLKLSLLETKTSKEGMLELVDFGDAKASCHSVRCAAKAKCC